jgi:hypothetical protein
LPKVQDLMVEYIAKIIQSVASSDTNSFQGKEKEAVSKYFPQSLTAKSPGAILDEINEKFDNVLGEFAKKSYNKSIHGFAIYFLESVSGISHNNAHYIRDIDKIFTRYDHHDLPPEENPPSLIGEAVD